MSQTTVPVEDPADQPAPADGSPAARPAAARTAPRRKAVRRKPSGRMPVADRRAALVEAAIAVIAREGVAAASTRAIVAEADMSLASFHYAFESHDALMREVVTQVLQREVRDITRTLAGAIDGARTVDELLRAGLDAFVASLAADPDRERAVLELHHYASRVPGFEDLVAAEYAAYHDAAERILLGVAAATGTRWTRPVAELAQYVITITDGFTLGWLSIAEGATGVATREIAVSALLSWNEPVAETAP